MSLCIAESQLFSGDLLIATIYSVSERPVPSGKSPMNQMVITVVAEGKTSDGIVQLLKKQLDTLEEKFGCIFTHLVRFGKLTNIMNNRKKNSQRTKENFKTFCNT